MTRTPSPGETGADVAGSLDWEVAYEGLLPKVFHYVWFRVGDPGLAEDLAATTFEKAWRHRGRFRGDLEAFSRWLFGIARNEVRGHYRRRKATESLSEAAFDPDDPMPDDIAQRNSDFRRLAILLRELNDRELELVGLKYGAEMTNRTIAQLTGLSESNVGTILHRVVVRLRQSWER